MRFIPSGKTCPKLHKALRAQTGKASSASNFYTYIADLDRGQRYTYRVLQTIQMKLILLWVWAERAVLGRAKTALKFKYEI